MSPAAIEATPFIALDDNQHVRKALKLLLRCVGAVDGVATAADPAAARVLLKEQPAATVLVDDGLPEAEEHGGCVFIREERPLHPDARFIIFTGGNVRDVAVRAAWAGADAFLAKPVNPEEFAAAFAEVRAGYQYFVRDALSAVVANLSPSLEPPARAPTDAEARAARARRARGSMLIVSDPDRGGFAAESARMLTGVSRVATASTLSAALELLRTGDFSLALVDEGSADAAGTDVIAAMRRELPEVDSILMTPRHSFGLAVPAAIAGARGIVEKPIDLGQFGAALREVREGHLFFVRRPLAEILARSRPAPPIAVALTPPEIDVLRGVFAGMSTAEIAADRGKSPDTVKTQIADGSKKLGVTSREEAAREARRLGIL